jgi:TonB-dependent receptor
MMKRQQTTAIKSGLRVSAMVLAIAACTQAWANDNQPEVVEVIGQAAQLEQALDEQRKSNSVESVVHADAIGQLPDDNAAEALQRIPGISVERDQGEGRFVRVRGLGSDLNSVTINGTLVPAPESDRRAVALDVLPSELIQSLSVVKTLTPDMDANSLGGTIEVESLSAFDHDDLFYSLSAEASHDDNSGETSPKLSGAFSELFSIGDGTDNFGVAAALSWQDREFGSDNVETGGAWDFDDGARLEEFEQRRYDITRERTGLGLNFDYRPDENSEIYLRTLYSRFTDDEERQSSVIGFADPQLEGELGDAEGSRELKAREETQEVMSFVLGGKRTVGDWTVSTQGGYSEAGEENPGGIAAAVFEGNDDFTGAGFLDTRKPRLIIEDGFYDPANFSLTEVEWESSNTTDTEMNLRLDLTRDFLLSDLPSQLQFGGKVSRRTKDNNLDVWVYEDFADLGFSDEQLSLSNFSSGNTDSGLGRFGPKISTSAVQNVINGLDSNDFVDEDESRINDFAIDEDINSAYVMNTLDIDDLRLIVGLRYEGTQLRAEGTGIREGEFEATNRENSYHHWLPGLHAIFQANSNTQVRAAWTNTVVRPTFGQVFPGFVLDGDEAAFGNPDLNALESSNLDLGIEHYMGRAGAVSAFVFYKDIKNFVYEADLAGTGEYVDFEEATTFVNGDSAEVYGLELGYAQKFSWLAAPWNGLLLNANTTVTSSSAGIEQFDEDLGALRSRDISLPGQSDLTGNLTLGWENETVSVRLAGNYKSDYLNEVGNVLDERFDYQVDDQLFVDFTASYFITPGLQVYFEAQNLTDEVYYVYTGNEAFNAQYEEYGPTYKVGVNFTHF